MIRKIDNRMEESSSEGKPRSKSIISQLIWLGLVVLIFLAQSCSCVYVTTPSPSNAKILHQLPGRFSGVYIDSTQRMVISIKQPNNYSSDVYFFSWLQGSSTDFLSDTLVFKVTPENLMDHEFIQSTKSFTDTSKVIYYLLHDRLLEPSGEYHLDLKSGLMRTSDSVTNEIQLLSSKEGYFLNVKESDYDYYYLVKFGLKSGKLDMSMSFLENDSAFHDRLGYLNTIAPFKVLASGQFSTKYVVNASNDALHKLFKEPDLFLKYNLVKILTEDDDDTFRILLIFGLSSALLLTIAVVNFINRRKSREPSVIENKV